MRFRSIHPVPDTRRRVFGWRRAFLAVLIMAVVFGVVTARLFVWPAQGMPPHVSAIVMLAGPVIALMRRLSSRASTGRPCSWSPRASTATGGRAHR